jgi:SAM-dependent methyltransferase/uncharacterized protein YbaR (Trm112 family)
MKLHLLEHLACPLCKASLTVHGVRAGVSSDDEVDQGELRCGQCDQSYPIRSGIPRFPVTTDSAVKVTVIRTRQTYDFTWGRFGASEIANNWEKDSYTYTSLIPAEIFEGMGKVGLDAGCGAGADLRRFWQRGIHVIGLDLSKGVDTVAQMGSVPAHGDLVQGDLQMIPFKSGTFDFIYSFGVLHHLPEPEQGFAALTRGLKPGGALVTYLYERFDNRSAVARAMLRGVGIIRKVTARVPPRILHWVCWAVVPFIWIAFSAPARILSAIGVRAAARLPFAHTLRWSVLAADLYDRFAPPVEHRLDEQQVRELYARCGLERVEVRHYRGWVSWGYKPEEARNQQECVAS